MQHLCLVDGSGYIFRAFYALPPMTRSDGTPVNAVYGFSSMLMKLINEMQADGAVVVFDAARKNFRNDIYPEYKANRKETPEELIPQFPILREAVEAFGLPSVEMEGFEADDLIATYTKIALAKGIKVTIVSADKDLMQLVGSGASIFDPIKSRPINEAEVFEKFGVSPNLVVDIQALAGDSSDNVPGVAGIGIKTAAQLINEYGNLENLLENASEIKQQKRRETLIANKELALISKQLVCLRDDVLVDDDLEKFKTKLPDAEKLMAFIQKQGFKSLTSRVENWLGRINLPNENVVQKSLVKNYELIQDETSLKKWIDEALNLGVVAIDTETDGLDSMQSKLVGFSLALEEGRACYIPLAHTGKAAQGLFDFGDGISSSNEKPKQIEVKKALGILKPLLENEGVLKIGHNFKFDMHTLTTAYVGDIKIKPIDDTMVMSYVLDGSQNGHGMDELAKIHLDYKTKTYSELCGTGKNQKSFAEIDVKDATDYAAEDADITLRLHKLFKKRLLLEKMVNVYEAFDRPLVTILFNMEREGSLVDVKELANLSKDFASKMLSLEKEVFKLAGEEFNIGSPKQLGEILFDKLKFSGGRKTAKSDAWATDAETLENLANEGHDLPKKVLEWRHFAKLKSTYTDSLANQINPNTKRVHTSFSQTTTSTGRLSSTNPNLQNIPIRTEEGLKIRKSFIAKEGHLLLAADYSQVELRLIAHVADIAAMKKAFFDGIDIHTATASEVFGIPVDRIDPVTRRNAKAINFGIIYGISAFGLAAQLGISRGEAKKYIDAYFARFPEIPAYMEKTKEEARKNGFVTTLFGRKCFVSGINNKNQGIRGNAERAAINAPIQGGAADIVKKAMFRINPALIDNNLNAKMLIQVHDELVFEVPENEAEKTQQVVKQVMMEAAKLSVPLEVDAKCAKNWKDAH